MAEFVIDITAKNIEDILYTPLWYNPLIKIHKKPVFYTKFFEKGFYYIRDIFKNDGKFIEYGELSDLYQIHIPFTTFHGLKTSILSIWPNLRDIDKGDIIPLSHRPRYLSMICKDEEGSKSMYNVFMKKLYQKPKSEEKWEVDLNLEDEFNLNNHFSYFRLLCSAKDHWRGFSTRNAHMVHIKFNPIKNGVYILVEVSFWILTGCLQIKDIIIALKTANYFGSITEFYIEY